MPKKETWRDDGPARWTSIAASLGLAAAIVAYCLWREGHDATLYFVLSVTGGVWAALVLATRRALPSMTLTAGVVAGVALVAIRKYDSFDMVFHAWDVVEFLSSTAPLGALWRDRPLDVVAGAAFLALVGAATAAAWRLDRLRAPRPLAACVLVACAVAAALAGEARPERSHLQYFWEDLHVASFYASFRETVEALARGGLVEASAREPKGPFPPAPPCAPNAPPPHIVLIHEESIAQPDLFPDLDFDRSLTPFFHSDDGATHKLRVETYGGASWLTEFSVLTGVSTRAFGSMRNFVGVFTAGKLADTLPQTLAKCGYKDIMFTPWDNFFMAASRFYGSIGFSEIADRRVQGNKIDNERDRFFFANALARIDRHLGEQPSAGPRQPLFLFIETMSAHWPYDTVYMPDVQAPGGGEGTPPQMNEYLRRLAMVKMDDDWLRAELARRFPNEKFLIVRYGDHHPVVTLPYLGVHEDIPAEAAVFPDDSLAFTTFYALNGVGFSPPPPPDIDTLDVAYLGAVALQAAGLPTPPAWTERLRLMRACDGRFWTCPDHGAILDFDRRLLESGQLPNK
jgi:hypothetical protein